VVQQRIKGRGVDEQSNHLQPHGESERPAPFEGIVPHEPNGG
jgi:hypothetical protein